MSEKNTYQQEKPLVLLVDDKVDIAFEGLIEVLREEHGFEVITAKTSKLALVAAEELKRPATVFLDRHLESDGNGRQVLAEEILQELIQRATFDINVIQFTVDVSEVAHLNAIRSGAMWSLDKNSSIELIVAHVWRSEYFRQKYTGPSQDHNTKALRKDAMFDRFSRELSRTERQGMFTLCAFFDVDGLKQVNDTCGHAAGDQLLRKTAEMLRGHMRPNDILCNLGGDEFFAIWCNVEEVWAHTFARAINSIIDGQEIYIDDANHNKGKLAMSASVGVVVLDPKRLTEVKNNCFSDKHDNALAMYMYELKTLIGEIVKEADKKMYIQKKQRKELQVLQQKTAA